MALTTHAQRAFFAERGYLPFGRVYAETEVERLRAALAQVQGQPARGGTVTAYNVSSEPGKVSLSLERMFRVHPAFRCHAFNPTIAAVAAELLDTEQLRLMIDQAIIKEPRISGKVHWHQDFSNWMLWPPSQVTCWLALDEVTTDSGAMQFVPSSHRLGERAPVNLRTGRKSPADPRPVVPADPAGDGYETVAVALAPGECVFHHALTWHATEANASDRRRRGLITRFMAKGTLFQPGRFRVRLLSPANGLAPGRPIERDDEFPIVWPQASERGRTPS